MTGKLRKGATLLAGGLMLALAGPVCAGALPTPEAAFRLVPHRAGGEEWQVPLHAEAIFPTRAGFALVMSGLDGYPCIACRARVWVAYFRKRPHGWRLQRVWRDLLRMGWEGKLSKVNRLAAGREGPLIALHASEWDAACGMDEVSIVELTPARPVVRILEARIGGNDMNRLTAPFAFYDARMKPMAGGGGVVFDYRDHYAARRRTVTYTGPGPRWTPRPREFDKGCW